MNLRNLLLVLSGMTMLIMLGTGYYYSIDKYFRKDKEITKAVYYSSKSYDLNVYKENVFNLEYSIISGVITFGLGLIMIGIVNGKKKQTI